MADRIPSLVLGLVLLLGPAVPGARAQTIELASPGSNGTSWEAAISADGVHVAFMSTATGLVPGIDANGGTEDIYVFNRATGTIARVSRSSTGVQGNGSSRRPSLSATGRYVVFQSAATNLVAGDTNGTVDVFRHDRDTDGDGIFDEAGAIATIRVSVGPAAAQANGPSRCYEKAVSDDGNVVVFESLATNLLAAADANGASEDCFARNVGAGTTSLLSSSAAGVQGNFGSYTPHVSGNGLFAVFSSNATNLVAPDGNGTFVDIFRKTLAGGAVALVSQSGAGAWSNGYSSWSSISFDGQVVAFLSLATNLVAADANGAEDVFVRDLAAGTTALASVSTGGVQTNGSCWAVALSGNGSVVAFNSGGANLVGGDANATSDVFARDLATGTTAAASRSVAGTLGDGQSGYPAPAISGDGTVLAFTSASTNLGPADGNGLDDIYVRTGPFLGPGGSGSAAAPPPMGPDGNPVTFSVNGPVDLQTDGLASPRGFGLPSGPFAARVPPVPPAAGIPTFRPGDVSDYAAIFAPSEAELFQSEPDAPVAAAPSGTNNQILVAAQCGLVAGGPMYPARDNIDGLSFGEDTFGVTEVSAAPSTGPMPWAFRGAPFAEPVVLGDAGTSFRFSVDPFATGLPATAVAVESGGADVGAGFAYVSPGEAAGDVFASPLLTLPALPPGGNVLVHDNPLLALAPGAGPMMPFEDDLDALECVGANDPSTWSPAYPGPLQPGNLHDRVIPLEPAHTIVGDLAPPSVANHMLRLWAPIFISVDRNSTGAPLSAVRTQWLAGEAAADVFMVYNDPFLFPVETNLLLADETELGLSPPTFLGDPTDELDGLLVLVHPDDRYLLMSIAMSALMSGLVTTVDPTPFAPMSGDEYRTGPGFSYSLLKYAYDYPLYPMPRIKIGFSVSTDSVGLEGSAVDFEAGLDPSGFAQQAGDVYFTYFGDWADVAGLANPAPGVAFGTNWLWHEETSLGLDAGTWVSGGSFDAGDLPDELNALDSIDTSPGTGPLYGTACMSAGGCTPRIYAIGFPVAGNAAFAIGLDAAQPGTLGALILGFSTTSIPLGLFIPGSACTILASMDVLISPIPVSPGAGCSGTAVVPMPVAAGALPGVTVFAQFAVIQPALFPAPLSVSMTQGLPITVL
ncbi:MAG TPA: hypothetical protein VFI25_08980 [Planctomycetota bacterium]|nr:hypothetical protein [Planctomycetota bacterium]